VLKVSWPVIVHCNAAMCKVLELQTVRLKAAEYDIYMTLILGNCSLYF
jgi:hypothetical protein